MPRHIGMTVNEEDGWGDVGYVDFFLGPGQIAPCIAVRTYVDIGIGVDVNGKLIWPKKKIDMANITPKQPKLSAGVITTY